LIIGLDGATFDYLNQWIGAGYLPTLRRLMENGACSNLASTIPPLTAPAWSTFATGLNPGKHGVFNFYQPIEKRPGERALCNSRDVKGVRFWNVLNFAGAKVGVVDLPMFYPPEEIEGFMVSDVISSGWKKALTYPEQKKADLEAALPEMSKTLGAPLTNGVMPTSSYLRKMVASLESKEALDLHLMIHSECDIFMTVYSHTDVFQHHFCHIIDNTHPSYKAGFAEKLAPLVERFIRRVDETVSRLIECSGCRNVILVSDHGFGPVKRVISINTLLGNLGYLHTKRDRMQSNSLTPGKVKSMAMAADLLGFRKFISKGMRHWLKEFLRKTLLPEIDWNNTQAHFAMQADYGIWINHKTKINPDGPSMADEEYIELVNRLVTDLRQAKDPENGAFLFDGVYRREEVFAGPYLESAPDIMLEPAFGYMASGDFSDAITIGQPKGLVTGCHRQEGIFVAWGENIQPGKLANARIEDVAPTILYLAGAPVPEGLDGRILSEVFSQNYQKAHPVSFFDASRISGPAVKEQADLSDIDEHDALERLRSLGYMQ